MSVGIKQVKPVMKSPVMNTVNMIRITQGENVSLRESILRQVDTMLQSSGNEDCFLVMDLMPSQEVIELQILVKQYTECMQKLSPREMDVLRLAIEGHQNPEIAEQLNISQETVKTHRRSILSKTNFGTIQDLKSFLNKVSRIAKVSF